MWRGWPLERRGFSGVESTIHPSASARLLGSVGHEQPCARSSTRRRSSRRDLRAADAHASPDRIVGPGARGAVRDDPAVGADDRSTFPMAHDAAQRRGPVALHRAVSFGRRAVIRPGACEDALFRWSRQSILGVSRRGMPGRSGDPIIESPDALVIDATTHNGIAHLAEFVQRDRDQMLVGIAVA